MVFLLSGCNDTRTQGLGESSPLDNQGINTPPSLFYPSDFESYEEDLVELIANGEDQDNDSLTYSWRQLEGTPVTIENSGNAVARFTAPAVKADESLLIQVSVADGNGGEAAGLITIKIRNIEIPDENLPIDTDGDGINDEDDTDDDNDGYLDFDEVDNGKDPLDNTSFPDDFDQDFISDLNDTDDDNDGYLDFDEIDNKTDPFDPLSFPSDFDKDFLSDLNDEDDDNDGYSDEDEIEAGGYRMCYNGSLWPNDLDQDKIPDFRDDDLDGDNVLNDEDDFPKTREASVDTDLDGKPDDFHLGCGETCQNDSLLILDLDDDNDSYSDILEKLNLTDPKDPNDVPQTNWNIPFRASQEVITNDSESATLICQFEYGYKYRQANWEDIQLYQSESNSLVELLTIGKLDVNLLSVDSIQFEQDNLIIQFYSNRLPISALDHLVAKGNLVLKPSEARNKVLCIFDDNLHTVNTAKKMNDTGIQFCVNNQGIRECPAEGFEGQDGETLTKTTELESEFAEDGFNFTKLDENGNVLLPDSEDYVCIQDNNTGLIWETKTVQPGLRHNLHSYTWYSTLEEDIGNNESIGTKNGGTCFDYENCDTEGYKNQINNTELCGLTNWRLPTREEARSLLNYGYSELAYTPLVKLINLPSVSNIWTSERPNIQNGYKAWMISTTNMETSYTHWTHGKFYKLVLVHSIQD
jgi:hypothetical protein